MFDIYDGNQHHVRKKSDPVVFADNHEEDDGNLYNSTPS